jgi:aspartyl/asparaginyl beta-hydroxylase (cupin superfamily)
MELFYTTEKYPKMKILEDNYEIIKNEIPEFIFENIKIKRTRDDWDEKAQDLIKSLEHNEDWIFSWQAEDKWFSFPLMYKNHPIGLAEKICPNTIKILKSLGNIKTCGFTLLYPKSSLGIHTDDVGPSFNSMALNMLLTGTDSDLSIYYNNSEYTVAQEASCRTCSKRTHIHEYGKAVIFNSELLHSASNNGDTNRVILYIDFELS